MSRTNATARKGTDNRTDTPDPARLRAKAREFFRRARKKRAGVEFDDGRPPIEEHRHGMQLLVGARDLEVSVRGE